MKILHIENGRNLYGGPQQVLYLANGLKGRGIINVVVCQPGSLLSIKLKESGIEVINLACRGEWDIFYLLRLVRVIQSEKPDIIHAHSRKGADFLGGLASSFLSKKSVLSRRVDSIEPKFISSLIYGLFNKVIAISENIFQIILSQNIDEKKVSLIRSSVETSVFDNQRNRDYVNKLYGISKNDFVLVAIGQLIPRKGYPCLINVMFSLNKIYPNMKLLIFGKGKMEASLKNLVTKKKLEKNVMFCGYSSILDEFLTHFDLMVHPAKNEGLGVSVLKASAAGLPVVAYDVGGVPEVVLDGVTGLLAKPDNQDQLKKNIEYLYKNKDYRDSCAKAGKQRMIDHFKVEEMINKHIRLYENTINER